MMLGVVGHRNHPPATAATGMPLSCTRQVLSREPAARTATPIGNSSPALATLCNSSNHAFLASFGCAVEYGPRQLLGSMRTCLGPSDVSKH